MAAQAMALSAAPLLVLAGGIIGQQLHSDPRFATLPVAAMICGTALFAWPAARLASRFGRRSLFLLAMMAGVVISAVAAVSVAYASFWGFTLAALGIGAVNAVVQQFRFVAMALVPAADQPLVASRLLLAGLVSAFLGPELTRVLDYFPEQGFAPAFAAQACLYLLAFALLLFMLPKSVVQQQGNVAGGRSWSELLQQPELPLAIAAAAVGYGVMAYIMTATPLSMTQVAGHSLEDARWVIQSHIAAMFLPSLVTGRLVQRFGYQSMIAAGLLLMSACLLASWWDQTLVHYWLGLVLLGIGWNLLFVAGTALLARCYQTAEAARVQGVNDLLVFSAQAFGALASGAVVLVLGWQGLLLTSLPALLILAILLLRQWLTYGSGASRSTDQE